MDELNYELPPIINAKDIAKYMNVSLSFAYQILRSENFPTIRLGRKLLAEKRDLIEWIEKNKDHIPG